MLTPDIIDHYHRESLKIRLKSLLSDLEDTGTWVITGDFVELMVSNKILEFLLMAVTVDEPLRFWHFLVVARSTG